MTDYLSLDELLEIADRFAYMGASVIAAQGPSGPEWLLRVPGEHGAERTYRAHRPDVVA